MTRMTDTTKWKAVAIRKTDYEELATLARATGASISGLIHEAIRATIKKKRAANRSLSLKKVLARSICCAASVRQRLPVYISSDAKGCH